MSETVTIEAPTTSETHEIGEERGLAVEQRDDQDEDHVATQAAETDEPIVQASGGADVTSQAPAKVLDTPVVDQAAAQVAGLDSADSDENFKRAARAFLDVHRDEVAQREEEISKLRAELKRVREGLKALEKAAQRPETSRDANHDEEWQLTVDDPDVTFQKIKEIWETCFIAVQGVMDADDAEEFLSDWSVVNWADLEEKMPGVTAFPLEASNKSSRTMLVMALLAKSLEDYILTPNYLFEDDDEVRFILSKMTDTKKKNRLRSLLLSACEGEDVKEEMENVKAFRVESAVNGVIQPIQSLLSETRCERVKATLVETLCDVVTAWQPVQRYESHFEVSTDASRANRDWLTLRLMEDKTAALESVNSSSFGADPVLAVVFPRVCAIDRSMKPSVTTAFPGIVFQKSWVIATDAATVEEGENAAEPDIEAGPAPEPNIKDLPEEKPYSSPSPGPEQAEVEVEAQPVKEEPKPIDAHPPITGSESEGSTSEDEDTEDGSETESNTEEI
ncbi:hypothetical protein LTR41_001740 [Exophiala xenobiotica]|nr:hypothetical protein LTR41_001740 [Exophiala xenobiotica]KAK5557420.1 hypothetical protein LTR46_004446 [Exophiala xenobiotica]